MSTFSRWYAENPEWHHETLYGTFEDDLGNEREFEFDVRRWAWVVEVLEVRGIVNPNDRQIQEHMEHYIKERWRNIDEINFYF